MKLLYHLFVEEIEKYTPGLSHQALLGLLILKIIINTHSNVVKRLLVCSNT